MNQIAKFAVLATALYAALPATAAIFVAGHPDDQELFMSGNLYGDIAGGYKTISIVITAGDAGAGKTANTAGYGTNSFGDSYALARMKGHQAALSFAFGLSAAPKARPATTTENHAGKYIDVSRIGHVTFYNLMLPDGFGNGSGFASTGNQSLQKLWNGNINAINAFDSYNNSYTRPQLIATLASILRSAVRDGSSTWLNIPEPLATLNPADHSDHSYSALFTMAAADQIGTGCFGVAKYIGYDVANRAANLGSFQSMTQLAALGAMNQTMTANGNPSNFDSAHLGWTGRQYYSVTNAVASCTF